MPTIRRNPLKWSQGMATGTLSLHGRFVTYALYVLRKAGEQI
jgi:hypothetical protein